MTYPREQDLQFHLHHCNRKQTTTVRKRLNTNGCSVASSKWDREFQALDLCGSHSGPPQTHLGANVQCYTFLESSRRADVKL